MATLLLRTLSKICGGVFFAKLVSGYHTSLHYRFFMNFTETILNVYESNTSYFKSLSETKESKHGQKEWYKKIASVTKRFNAVALSEKFNGELTETKS